MVKYSLVPNADMSTRATPSFWTSIGDTTIEWSEQEDAPGLRDAAQGRLHLVIQVGDTFRISHPDARVVLERGRHLIVDMTSCEVKRFTDPDECCWTIRSLPRNSRITDTVHSVQRAADPAITSLLGNLSTARYQANLEHLASFRTRHSLSPEFLTAADWARTQFEALGYTVTTENVAVGSGTSRNIVAERKGSGTGPRDLVFVIGHLDSVNLPGGPNADAPGADDNGSGATGVLEIAAVLSTTPTVHDLRFILFGGEEQGLFGSKHHVAQLSAVDKARTRAVLNMDMIASSNGTPGPTVLLEGAALSQSMMDTLAEAAANYTTLTVQSSLNPFGSDHVPFLNALIPAVLTIEGADSANTNIHTANDTLAHIDYALAEQILRMNIAAVADDGRNRRCDDGGLAAGRSGGVVGAWASRCLRARHEHGSLPQVV